MVVLLNGNVLVEDQKVKCGACTFDIPKDGEVQGFKHGPGFRLPYLEGCLKHKLQFMTCPNQKKTLKWPVGDIIGHVLVMDRKTQLLACTLPFWMIVHKEVGIDILGVINVELFLV